MASACGACCRTRSGAWSARSCFLTTWIRPYSRRVAGSACVRTRIAGWPRSPACSRVRCAIATAWAACRTSCPVTSVHHAARDPPAWTEGGARLRLIAGNAYARRAPVQVLSPLFDATGVAGSGAVFDLPAEHAERALCVLEGEVELGDGTVRAGELPSNWAVRPDGCARTRPSPPCCSAVHPMGRRRSCGGTSSPPRARASSRSSATGAKAVSAACPARPISFRCRGTDRHPRSRVRRCRGADGSVPCPDSVRLQQQCPDRKPFRARSARA